MHASGSRGPGGDMGDGCMAAVGPKQTGCHGGCRVLRGRECVW